MKWVEKLSNWFHRHEVEFYELVRLGNKHEIRLFTISTCGMALSTIIVATWIALDFFDKSFPIVILISIMAGIYSFIVGSFRRNILYTQREHEDHEAWLVRARKLEKGLTKIDWLLIFCAIAVFIIRYIT